MNARAYGSLTARDQRAVAFARSDGHGFDGTPNAAWLKRILALACRAMSRYFINDRSGRGFVKSGKRAGHGFPVGQGADTMDVVGKG
ncbi:hypothetical protein [Rhizobium sp. 007]|uniref:hypothetical protein n=1 Tax=Rhizobium sp. 007 TaxID=2785056 RepID=UPI001890B0D6|nr:hypothetical protein [Rhizobium sp. 007]QPB22156.1 hypothetical protein ISN39_14780 [Rhizobium sp. 007]